MTYTYAQNPDTSIYQLSRGYFFLFTDLYFLQMTLRTTALSHRAPSPGSASPHVAAGASGAPGAAATAMCPAMMTPSAMTTAPSPTSSTGLIQAP